MRMPNTCQIRKLKKHAKIKTPRFSVVLFAVRETIQPVARVKKEAHRISIIGNHAHPQLHAHIFFPIRKFDIPLLPSISRIRVKGRVQVPKLEKQKLDVLIQKNGKPISTAHMQKPSPLQTVKRVALQSVQASSAEPVKIIHSIVDETSVKMKRHAVIFDDAWQKLPIIKLILPIIKFLVRLDQGAVLFANLKTIQILLPGLIDSKVDQTALIRGERP